MVVPRVASIIVRTISYSHASVHAPRGITRAGLTFDRRKRTYPPPPAFLTIPVRSPGKYEHSVSERPFYAPDWPYGLRNPPALPVSPQILLPLCWYSRPLPTLILLEVAWSAVGIGRGPLCRGSLPFYSSAVRMPVLPPMRLSFRTRTLPLTGRVHVHESSAASILSLRSLARFRSSGERSPVVVFGPYFCYSLPGMKELLWHVDPRS